MSPSNKVALAELCKRQYHALHIANHIHCYLSSVFAKKSDGKTKQSVAFGLLLLVSIFTTPVSALSAQIVFGVDTCNRTAQVQRAILEITNSIRALFNFEDPSNCGAGNPNRLSKNLATIASLKSGDFDTLSGLASLRLQDNTITTPLLTDLFSDLRSNALLEIDLAPSGDLADIPLLLVGNTTPLDVSGAFISKDTTGSDRTISFSVTPTGTAVSGKTVDEAVVTITAISTAIGTGNTTVSVTANDGVGTDATRIVATTNEG